MPTFGGICNAAVKRAITSRFSLPQQFGISRKTDLKSKYPAYKQVITKDETGVIIPVKDTSVRVVTCSDGNQPYCQVDTDHLGKDGKVPPEVVERIKHLLPEENTNDVSQFWKWLPRYAYDETYQLLCEVIGAIVGI